MADFPYVGTGSFIQVDGITLASTLATKRSITSTAKSAWFEMTTSLSDECNFVVMSIVGPSDRECIIDVGIGTAGNEEVIMSNLYVPKSQGDADYYNVSIPMNIPEGSRVSVSGKSVAATANFGMAIYYYASSFLSGPGINSLVSIGVTETPVSGTAVDTAGTNDTKGAWVEITASSTEAKFIIMMIGGNQNAALSNSEFFFDIAIGSAGNEVAIVENMGVGTRTTEYVFQYSAPIPVSIPSGSRISVRSQSNQSDVTDRVLDVALYLGD